MKEQACVGPCLLLCGLFVGIRLSRFVTTMQAKLNVVNAENWG